jgi:hypothetical protein
MNTTNLDNVIVLLNDGETFTNVRGCRIVTLPDNLPDDDSAVEDWIRENPDEGKNLEDFLPAT